MPGSQLNWDCGTAYDLFVSLEVIYHPADFDARGVWAAGVRARLPVHHRTLLEQSLRLFHVPFAFIHRLPEPKDGNTLLWSLRQIPSADRLPALAIAPDYPREYEETLRKVADRKRWDDEDHLALASVYRHISKIHEKKPPTQQDISTILDWWTRLDEFGERYLEALNAYFDVFYHQEERRIRPILDRELANAQAKAEIKKLIDLIEDLTQGVRFEELPSEDQIVLAPSFWSTPLVYFGQLMNGSTLYLFGARPTDIPLVPGEMVPDGLLRVLNALSDTTRLQILQYLSEQSMSPTQLSNRLRLRVPTVVHHLKVLRLAGLVRLTLGENAQTKHYAARPEAVTLAHHALERFLSGGKRSTNGSV